MGNSKSQETVKASFNDASNIKIKYISDSGRNWRENCFCQHIGKFDNIQILIHPLHWVLAGESYNDNLREYEKFHKNMMKVEFDDMIDLRKKYIQKLDK